MNIHILEEKRRHKSQVDEHSSGKIASIADKHNNRKRNRERTSEREKKFTQIKKKKKARHMSSSKAIKSTREIVSGSNSSGQ